MSSARKLGADIADYRRNNEKLLMDISLCDKDVIILNSQKSDLLRISDGYKKDKEVLTVVLNDYKDKWEKTSGELNKCKVDVPSRFVWASIGAGAATVFFTVIAVLIAFK